MGGDREGESRHIDFPEAALLNIPPSLYKDWTGFLREEFEGRAVIRNRDEILKGEVKHYLLSCLGNILAVDMDEAASRAAEKTIARYPLVDPKEELEGFLRSLLSNAGLKNFSLCRTDVFIRRRSWWINLAIPEG